jgi:hypothetical protein
MDSVDNADSPFGMGNPFGDGSNFVHAENEIADVPESRVRRKGFDFRFGDGRLFFASGLKIKVKVGESRRSGNVSCCGNVFEKKDISALFARRPLAD